MRNRVSKAVLAAAAAGCLLSPGPVLAQEYPDEHAEHAGHQMETHEADALANKKLPGIDLDKYKQMMAAYPQVLIARRTILQANVEAAWASALPLRVFLLMEALASRLPSE